MNESNAKPHSLHVEGISKVSAKAQSEILEKIEPKLNEEELDIVRRGRNTKNYHSAKNASTYEYSRSTGFEALLGYLFLMGEHDRLEEIMKKAFELD